MEVEMTETPYVSIHWKIFYLAFVNFSTALERADLSDYGEAARKFNEIFGPFTPLNNHYLIKLDMRPHLVALAGRYGNTYAKAIIVANKITIPLTEPSVEVD